MKNDQTIIVSGIQPTGEVHLGNWAGGLRNWKKLQDENPGRCLFFVADYHSMTIEYDPAEKRARSLDAAATLLALGIGDDPSKSTLFLQSDVPEVTELCWILNTVTPVVEMERMTQYKDKSAKHVKNVNMGLLDYPVLQAADILIYGGTRVPVGLDQVQHVETTRVIAKAFNKRFGETFPGPKEVLNDTPKIMSLTEPTKKMSKSLGPKSYIALDDDPDVILEKLKRVPTEPSGHVSADALKKEEYAGVANLLGLHAMFCGRKDCEFGRLGEMKYSKLKEHLAEAIAEFPEFKAYRAARKELAKNPYRVSETLSLGAQKARGLAQAKMEEVRRKTGLR